MQDLVNVTGMVLKAEPYGEYDRRLVILTLERGKISCFAKGARKQGNRMMAATNPFCFGEFKLFEGRNSYSVNQASISHYFEEMRLDYEMATMGMYFLELMDYYTLENNDERDMLKLLFLSVKALTNNAFDNRLVKNIIEIKSIMLNGEYPGDKYLLSVFKDLDTSTLYTLKFIESTNIEKLYSFAVSDKVLEELNAISLHLMNKFVDKRFKSLEILGDYTP